LTRLRLDNLLSVQGTEEPVDSRRTRGLALTTAFLIALGILLAPRAGSALATHVQCGDTITRDTTLDSDLIDCPGDGIVIGADNVSVDLKGHTVDGTDGYTGVGVSNGGLAGNDGHERVVVKNGTVREFGSGILFIGADHGVVRNVIASGNEVGIGLSGGSDSNLIQKSTVEQNGVGILVSASQSNLVERNYASNNSFAGIAVDDVLRLPGNTVRHNVTVDNHTGINLGEGYYTEVERNSVSGNRIGIHIGDSNNNKVEKNSVSDNDEGIRLESGSRDNRILGNFALRNGDDGIFIRADGAENLVKRNVAKTNGDDGIDTDSPTTTLIGNRAHQNADLGIEAVPGVIDGGGNSAFGNGNPMQCLNVACK
jgi:parallel beta-helix repeat protein